MALTFGAALGLLTILKVLDIGFTAALGRPFNPVIDWSYLGAAVGVLSDSVGGPAAVAAVVARRARLPRSSSSVSRWPCSG